MKRCIVPKSGPSVLWSVKACGKFESGAMTA